MGKLVVSDNVSLDGVIQDPAGDEGFERGGWVGLIKDRPELNQLALDENKGDLVAEVSRLRHELKGTSSSPPASSSWRRSFSTTSSMSCG